MRRRESKKKKKRKGCERQREIRKGSGIKNERVGQVHSRGERKRERCEKE